MAGSLTGTYAYNPSLGDLTLQAFQMCGVRPTALTQEHMQSALMAANLMMSTWSGKGVNLWQVTSTTVPLIQGQATYSVPANVVTMLDLYVSVASGTSTTDRYILPISRTEYASYANKSQQGFCTTYWFDRLLTPSVTFWPVPDGSAASFTYYACVQIQDSSLQSGALVDVPYYFLEAFAYGLAYRLAAIWKPEITQGLKALADEAFAIAAEQNIETSSVYISPSLQGYFKI